MSKFFSKVFGSTGDKTTVPDTTQLDGSVSYDQGYGPDYERPKTDPLSKNIERPKQNQLFYDITAALKEWQTQSYPAWITSTDNGGVAFTYNKGATIRYTDGNIYQARKSTSALPTVTTDWTQVDFQVTSGSSGSFKVGPLIIKYGSGSAGAAGANFSNVFPEAFPSACFMALACHVGTDASVNVIVDSTTPVSPTQFGARSNFSSAVVQIFYVAVGI